MSAIRVTKWDQHGRDYALAGVKTTQNTHVHNIVNDNVFVQGHRVQFSLLQHHGPHVGGKIDKASIQSRKRESLLFLGRL